MVSNISNTETVAGLIILILLLSLRLGSASRYTVSNVTTSAGELWVAKHDYV